MSFGFLPNEGQPDFEAMMRQFSEMGLDPNALMGAKTFFESAQSVTAAGNQNLITIDALRDIARKIIAAKGEQPIGTSDQKKVLYALEIANTWLDAEILFPASSSNLQPACLAFGRKFALLF